MTKGRRRKCRAAVNSRCFGTERCLKVTTWRGNAPSGDYVYSCEGHKIRYPMVVGWKPDRSMEEVSMKRAMPKTVAVECFICGWSGRRHRTEMERPQSKRAVCPNPKCHQGTVVYQSPVRKPSDRR